MILTLWCVALLLALPRQSKAQCLVEDPSFEAVIPSAAPLPGWGPGPTPPSVDVSIPGVIAWFTRGYSPDFFWPPLYVPNNYMTNPAIPLGAFHGTNYAGILSGYDPSGGFRTEILSGRLTAPPTPGLVYEVRARVALGTALSKRTFIRISLGNSSPAVRWPLGATAVTSPKWIRFSRFFTAPAGVYDRIVIEGIDSVGDSVRGFTFIDSVDICRASPCDHLGAHLTRHDSTGDCCFDLSIDNTMPPGMTAPFGVRVSTTAPVEIAGPTFAPGVMITTATSTAVTWQSTSSGSALGTGTGLPVGHYCLDAHGVTPQRHVVDFLDSTGGVICSDTLYTNCAVQPPPCIDLIEMGPGITCDSIDASGNRRYQVTFGVTPLSWGSFPMGANVHLSSPQGTFSPSVVTVSGTTAYVGPISFTDTPPVDTTICIIAEFHLSGDMWDSTICRDTLCLPLPRCPENCCDNFIKQITGTALSYVNGAVTLKGCALAGPAQIRRFSATIISAQAREITIVTPPAGGPPLTMMTPWYTLPGDITSGTLSSILKGPYYVAGADISREVSWGGSGAPICADFSPCAPFTLHMLFPDPPGGAGNSDELQFAVRYSFTDCQCRTCDTVITYLLARNNTKLPWTFDPTSLTPTTTTTTFSGPRPWPGLLRVEMSTEHNGTLNVTLPESAPEAPAIRIVGMGFRPLGSALLEMKPQGSQTSLPITGNEATSDLVLDGGQSALFDLTYSNGDDEYLIENLLRFRYLMLPDTLDTICVDRILVQAHTPNGSGDDDEEERSPEARNVHTYALHIDATNSAGADIHAIRVKSGGDAQLIAVGPVGNGTDAFLTSGTDKDGNAVTQVNSGTWVMRTLPNGATLTPIYLTFSGAEDGASIEYETLDGNGAVLTSGSVTLGSPLRAAGTEGESAEQQTTLWPVYPNPTGTSATVGFRLRGSGSVMLSIRDMQGHEVLRRVDGTHFDAGDHLIPVQTDGLAKGTYIVILTVDGRSYSRALTVVR